MPQIWKTVTQSQIFGWLRLQKNKGYPSNCISLTSNKIKIDTEYINNQIGGIFTQHRIMFIPVIQYIQIFIILFYYYCKYYFRSNKIIFHTRVQITSFPLLLLKLLPKVRIIFDARGASLEEFHYTNLHNENSIKKKIKYWIIKLEELILINISDKIFCVSNKLKEYFKEKYSILSEKKFLVIPSAADSNLFYYNDSIRKKYRKKLEIENSIILVYSGRLAMKWEMPEKIFELYRHVFREINKLIILIITPDFEIGNFLRKKYKLSNRQIKIVSVKHEEVCNYLNASDFALMLRDNVKMNNVASPTKLAEYILCGLPILITNNIGDFSRMIEINKYGFIINDINYIKENISQLVTYIKNICINKEKQGIIRKKISKWGIENLSKEIYLDKIIEILETI